MKLLFLHIPREGHLGSSVSVNARHDVADVIREELHDCGMISNVEQVKYDVLQRQPTLLIGQTTAVVVIETVRHVQ